MHDFILFLRAVEDAYLKGLDPFKLFAAKHYANCKYEQVTKSLREEAKLYLFHEAGLRVNYYEMHDDAVEVDFKVLGRN